MKTRPGTFSSLPSACVVALLLVLSACRPKPETPAPEPAPQARGERFEFDDFYEADSGTWVLETPVDLLREQKYVSGPTERQNYLVYAAQPSETVVIHAGAGRWKQVDVLAGDRIVASGWVDANRKSARRVP